jgi:peptide/nickel transport system substrate-binding protein
MVVLTVLAGCGDAPPSGGPGGSAAFADCPRDPNGCNSGPTRSGGTLTYAIEKAIGGWNVGDADASSFETTQVLAGLLPSAFVAYPDLTVRLNEDLLVSAEQTAADPQVVVYKIKPTAVWDDGTPISADDFQYAWRTQNGRDCQDCAAASTAGYDRIASVTAGDGGRTATVTFASPYPEWRSLFGQLYPANVAAAHGSLAESWSWFNTTTPEFSGGPYKIAKYEEDVAVTEVPNPRWYGAVRPSLDKLVFRIITDQAAEASALRGGEVQVIYPLANADLVATVKAAGSVQYVVGKGLSWEHLDLNLRNPMLADKALRRALFTAIDRDALIDRTVGLVLPDTEPLNSHNFVPGQSGYRDVITPTGQGAGDVTSAKKVLSAAGYGDVGGTLTTPGGQPVSLRVTYAAGNDQRRQLGELLQTQLEMLGIQVKITPVEDFGAALTSGNYDMILFAWTGTPYPVASALQTWTSDSNFGGWHNAASDDLLKQAGRETDQVLAATALNDADQILAEDAYVLPLFRAPTLLAINDQVVNVRDNVTSTGPTYNIAHWGLRR